MQTAGQNVLGRSGAVIFALLISVACLGSININVFTSARLTISAGKGLKALHCHRCVTLLEARMSLLRLLISSNHAALGLIDRRGIDCQKSGNGVLYE